MKIQHEREKQTRIQDEMLEEMLNLIHKLDYIIEVVEILGLPYYFSPWLDRIY